MMQNASTFMESPLGIIQISCNDHFVTAVRFFNGPVDQVQLNSSKEIQPILINCVEQLQQYFKGERQTFDLPISQPGTAFQKKIWSLLEEIPFGKTITYKQLTTRFGDLKAIRAVASANGKNDLAIIIPCHRVIGSNGSLTGYAGELWRKKWLLEHESALSQGELFPDSQ